MKYFIVLTLAKRFPNVLLTEVVCKCYTDRLENLYLDY